MHATIAAMRDPKDPQSETSYHPSIKAASWTKFRSHDEAGSLIADQSFRQLLLQDQTKVDGREIKGLETSIMRNKHFESLVRLVDDVYVTGSGESSSYWEREQRYRADIQSRAIW